MLSPACAILKMAKAEAVWPDATIVSGDAVDELGGDDVDAGEAAIIEIVEVVQTARCAGPSIR